MTATQTPVTPWTRFPGGGYSWTPEGPCTYTAERTSSTWTLRIFNKIPYAGGYRTVLDLTLTAATLTAAKAKAREHRRIEATR